MDNNREIIRYLAQIQGTLESRLSIIERRLEDLRRDIQDIKFSSPKRPSPSITGGYDLKLDSLRSRKTKTQEEDDQE